MKSIASEEAQRALDRPINRNKKQRAVVFDFSAFSTQEPLHE